jgi:hypothetical protein
VRVSRCVQRDMTDSLAVCTDGERIIRRVDTDKDRPAARSQAKASAAAKDDD